MGGETRWALHDGVEDCGWSQLIISGLHEVIRFSTLLLDTCGKLLSFLIVAQP
jgi:hypothetical protein